MTVEIKPLVEINRRALRVLYQELGVVDAVRFLRQFTVSFGDYTKERREIFAGKTLKEIVEEIERCCPTGWPVGSPPGPRMRPAPPTRR